MIDVANIPPAPAAPLIARATAALTAPDGARAATELLRLADRLTTAAVAIIARAGSGAIEVESGLPAEFVLRLDARRAAWDARELASVADATRTMPALGDAMTRGVLSYSQARAIVRAGRGLDAAGRARLDALIARRAPALRAAEPEQIVAEVDDFVARARADRELRREDYLIETSFLAMQGRLGGGGTLYGEADAERFATIARALDDAAERPAARNGEAADAEREPTARARQRMDALVAVCEAHLAGGSTGGTGTRPRPRLIASVDIAALAELGLSEASRVLAPVAGRPMRLTPVATETLSCDAEVVTVAFDGGVPVSVSDVIATIPTRMRRVVLARDGGCRFPGCGAPASWCDVHHIRARADGGPAVTRNLVLLCRRCHRRVHRFRWRIRVLPDDTIEFRHRGRRSITLPRARPPRE